MVSDISKEILFSHAKFCWICGRRFYGNKKYLITCKEDNYIKAVHKACAKKAKYEEIESNMLARREAK